jgi:preprotein translocase subunit SecY
MFFNKQYSNSSLKVKLAHLSTRKKLLVLALLIIILRIGMIIPLPFVDPTYFQSFFENTGFGFLNAMMGRSLEQMSIFALSVSPYITASIIMQLMTILIKPLEDMQKDGKVGADKYKKITIGVGVVLAFIQASGMAIGLGRMGLLRPYNIYTIIASIIIWTLGAATVIMMGTVIDWLQIGQGMSILLCANILASLPKDCMTLYNRFMADKLITDCVKAGIIIALIFIVFIAACAKLVTSEKKVPITHTKKISGFSDSTFPVPYNLCSVMPLIFTSTITSIPLLISVFVPEMKEGVWEKVLNCLNSSNWFILEHWKRTLGAVIYFGLSTFFTTYYINIGFNAKEIANNFRKAGIVINGVHPGVQTEQYIEKVSTKVALIGNTVLTTLVLIMFAIQNNFGISLAIAGTSLIIVVAVFIEEMKIVRVIIENKKN